MPRYAALIYGAEPSEEPGAEQTAQVIEDYNEFSTKVAAAGVMAGGEALYGTDTATTVRVEGGKGGEMVATDGPFAETKEVLGGFYLLDCADLDEALSWAAQIPGAWHGGRIEVRPCVDFGESDS
ncbi:MAG: YciI family protein [Acidimicrobiia bacterium]